MSSNITYEPSPHDRALKAAFLIATKHLPDEPEGYSLGRIEQLCPGLNLSNKWNVPGYREWFLNSNEFQELAELASVLAIKTCIDVMTNPDEKGQARVTAAKLAIEAADKLPKGKPVSALPKSIENMDEDQIRQFLSHNKGLLASV